MTGGEEPPMNPLRMLVLRRLADLGAGDRPLSARVAADRATASGNPVSYSTLYDIINGKHSGRLTDSKIRGVAAALDVPVNQVYEAAGLPRPQTRWAWPEQFDRIAPEHRPMFEKLAAAFLEAERRGYERGLRQQ